MQSSREKCAMIIMRSGKQQMIERIELPNEEKSQNAQRKVNVQIIRNIRSGHHQISRNERKVSQEKEKTTQKQTTLQKFFERYKKKLGLSFS